MYKLQPTMCCGDTTKLQHDYYLNQAGQGLPHFSGGANQYGHGLPYYSGGEFQRGHGIGTLMSGAINQALPVLRPHLMKIVRGIKRKVAEAGIGVVKDVISGKRLKTSVKDRALETIGINSTEKRPTPYSRAAPRSAPRAAPSRVRGAKKPIKRRAPKKVGISTQARGRATSDRFQGTVLR